MTPLVRKCHRIAVAVHFSGLVIFAWAYSLEQNIWWAVMAGWAAIHGARSLAALRKFGKDRGGE